MTTRHSVERSARPGGEIPRGVCISKTVTKPRKDQNVEEGKRIMKRLVQTPHKAHAAIGKRQLTSMGVSDSVGEPDAELARVMEANSAALEDATNKSRDSSLPEPNRD